GFNAGPVLSAAGRFVAFHSTATNLVAGDTNGATDVFVHDRQTGTTERVSVASGGTQGNDSSAGPALSADGPLVASHSTAPHPLADHVDDDDSDDHDHHEAHDQHVYDDHEHHHHQTHDHHDVDDDSADHHHDETPDHHRYDDEQHHDHRTHDHHDDHVVDDDS